MTDGQKGIVAGFLKVILFLLSLLYGVSLICVKFCYKAGICKVYRPRCKVISVGNITLGGTGKTPLVEKIVRYLKNKSSKVVILIRGYGKDEDILLKEKLGEVPIMVGRNRVRNAREAIIRHNPDIMVLDDGFQHWRMARDLDIVAIDCTNPFGNKRLLPRGILREPLSSLKRAGILVLTRADIHVDRLPTLKEKLMKVNPRAFIYQAWYEPVSLYSLFKTHSSTAEASCLGSAEPGRLGCWRRQTGNKPLELSFLHNKKVCLVSGIGNPASFRKVVEGLNTNVALDFSFPDHYRYRATDLDRIADRCKQENVEVIVTTEKDAVRLRRLVPQQLKAPASARPSLEGSAVGEILVLRVELKIKEEEQFLDRLSVLLSG